MKKGFTLFTALVSVLLIFLGILIMQAMLGGERGAREIIENVQEEEEMLDFAALRTADAVAQFNFKLRIELARYFSEDKNPQDEIPDNPFTIDNSILNAATRKEQWDLIKENFITQYFGELASPNCQINNPLGNIDFSECKSYQIAEFTANGITDVLRLDQSDNAAYFAEIEEVEEEKFKKILVHVFARSAKKGEFLEISDCDGDYLGGNCSGGGFYINLDFSEEIILGPGDKTGINDEVYEALPQIKITKRESCEGGSLDGPCFKVLKQPIFPRSIVRIFVPVRIFKAIAAGHQAINKNGELIFARGGQFKEDLKKIKLGVCDSEPNYCIFLLPPPDPNDESPPPRETATIQRHICKPRESFLQPQTTPDFSNACIGHKDLPQSELLTNVNPGYNPNKPEDVSNSARDAIQDFVNDEELEAFLNDFSSVEDVLRFGEIQTLDKIDKFEIIKNSAGKFFWNVSVDVRDFESRTIMFDNAEVGKSTCSKISGVQGTFVFEEKNTTYLVNEDPDVSTRFAVRILDADYHTGFGQVYDPTEFANVKCTTESVGDSLICPDPNDYLFGPCS